MSPTSIALPGALVAVIDGRAAVFADVGATRRRERDGRAQGRPAADDDAHGDDRVH